MIGALLANQIDPFEGSTNHRRSSKHQFVNPSKRGENKTLKMYRLNTRCKYTASLFENEK